MYVTMVILQWEVIQWALFPHDKNCQQEKQLWSVITAIYLCTPGPPAEWPYVIPVTGHMTIWTYVLHLTIFPHVKHKILKFKSPISIWRRAPCRVTICHCHTSIGSHPMGPCPHIYEVENCLQELWWSSDHRYLFGERPPAELPNVTRLITSLTGPYAARSSSCVGNRNRIPWLAWLVTTSRKTFD